MRFDDWIKESGLRPDVIAKKLKMARTRLWRLSKGKAEPTLEEVYDIYILSKHKVTWRDFLDEIKSRKQPAHAD